MINVQRSGMKMAVDRATWNREDNNPIENLKSGDFNKIISAQMAQQPSISANQLNKYTDQLTAYNQHWSHLTGNATPQNVIYGQQAYAAPPYNYSAYTPTYAADYTGAPYALLGKTVTANAQAYDSNGTATTTQVSGVVQGVYIENNQTYLSVNGYRVNPADVLSVDGAATAQTVAAGAAIGSDASLIGKTVSASYTDKSGNEQIIEGVVTNVRSVLNKTFATINGVDIDVNAIHAVLSGANGVAGAYGAAGAYGTAGGYMPYGALNTQTLYANPYAMQAYGQRPTLPPDPDIAGIEIGQGTARAAMPDTIARTASYGGNFAASTTGAGSVHYYNNNMQQMLQWIQMDPGLLTDGEFSVTGTPDADGAFG